MINVQKTIGVWGDSILKGVIFDEIRGTYQLLTNNGASIISKKLGLNILNKSKFGCTIGKGKRILEKSLFLVMAVMLVFGTAACRHSDTADSTSTTGISNEDHLSGTSSGTFDSSGSQTGSQDYSSTDNSGPDSNGTAGPASSSATQSAASSLSSPASSAASSTGASSNGTAAPGTSSSSSSITAKTVKVTIIEGESMVQIFKKLESKGVCSFDSLMTAAESYDFSYYPLIAARPEDANRCFELEGYLFPDTYEFYIGEKPQNAIGRMIRNAETRITAADRAKAETLSYSMDQVMTVASIIQKEGSKASEVGNVAAVIYNRLKSGQKLQMDSTINYIELYVKNYITGDNTRYNSFYNTYKSAALPAGPICNPGKTTISAALNPSDVPYLFFCHDTSGNYYYATTYEEHLANLKLAGIS